MMARMLSVSNLRGSFVLWLTVLAASLCFGGAAAQIPDAPKCHFNSSDGTFLSDCPYFEMTERTYVYPGGETLCLNASEPFFWDVFPGRGADANNLIINFDGGGHCRNEFECTNDLWDAFIVKRFPEPKSRGIFDRTNPENPFRDWAIVNVLACSGDAHTGNSDLGGESMVKFRGQINARVALDWVELNFPEPDRLMILGCSSGSIGAQYWTRPILNFYQDKGTVASVVYDSLVGELTWVPGFASAMSEVWDSCSVAHLQIERPADYEACLRGEYTIFEEQFLVQSQFRDTVPFAFLSFKDDDVIGAAYCYDVFPEICPQGYRYQLMQQVIRNYLARTDNVVSYFVNGRGHCFTNDDDMYTRSGVGAWGRPYGNERFVDWLRDMAYRDPTSTFVESRCVTGRISIPPVRDRSCDAQLTLARYRPYWGPL